MSYDYGYFQKSADYIRSIIGDFQPEIGLILGTGLGRVSEMIENPVEIPYKDIPNFLVSTAPGHKGRLITGTLEGRKVVCMAGRFHSYEGYGFEQLIIPVRVLKLLGIKMLICTNAAGAINQSYKPGDLMVISDHIKMTGVSPLCGPNVDEFGPRFFDVTKMYDPRLRKIAMDCAKETELTVHEGVYFFFTGPQFETPAEIRAARVLGGDAAGMSTVTEALTAAHCGLPVLGISLMTNMAAGMSAEPLSGSEVDIIAENVRPKFEKYFMEIVRRLPR